MWAFGCRVIRGRGQRGVPRTFVGGDVAWHLREEIDEAGPRGHPRVGPRKGAVRACLPWARRVSGVDIGVGEMRRGGNGTIM